MSRIFVEERRKLEAVKSEIELKKKQHWEAKGGKDGDDIHGDPDDDDDTPVNAASTTTAVAAPSASSAPEV
jgi:hypothetical protein